MFLKSLNGFDFKPNYRMCVSAFLFVCLDDFEMKAYGSRFALLNADELRMTFG